MKTIFLSLALLFTSSIYLRSQTSENNFDLAKKAALKNNKHIILVFQGSDWCAPCIKLEKEILDTEEFKKLSEENFIVVKADFPRNKKNKLPEDKQKQNNELFEKYNKGGYFPYVVVLDNNGKILGATGYEKTTPEKYYEKLISYI